MNDPNEVWRKARRLVSVGKGFYLGVKAAVPVTRVSVFSDCPSLYGLSGKKVQEI